MPNGLNRRRFINAAACAPVLPRLFPASGKRPNILFAIADDQSWMHAGAYGDRVVKTPAFDRIAERGVLFTNAFSGSPGCAPSRAAILTGRSPWQLEEAGTHASLFPRKFQVYPGILAAAGYHTGFTGKGAGPCNWRDAGWPHNPAGPEYNRRKAVRTSNAVSVIDYAANFEEFLRKKPAGSPFCFWYGAQEPHRPYRVGSGLESGKRLQDVVLPPFLPDVNEVRGDMLDYYLEIEHFDRQLGKIIAILEKSGELENTLLVATADNGMSFPRAKATMYEYGIHLPLAVSWPARFAGGRKIDDLVSFMDFAPTFLEAAGAGPNVEMTGRSILNVLDSKHSGRVDASRDRIFSGRERHSHSRFDNLGYPARAIRTHEYLYIRNFKPDRWPAGDPEGYFDIDACPSKDYLLKHRESERVKRLFELTCGKNPSEQMYDIRKDPGCLDNLADAASHAMIRARLREQLDRRLMAEKDPRATGSGDIWESYPRFSPMRPQLGGFAEVGKYNPKYQQARRSPV
ncbi:MAG: sulfatase [Bryobacterales bacterium]|nr:sulfatase [Bryobacterales bacterium]